MKAIAGIVLLGVTAFALACGAEATPTARPAPTATTTAPVPTTAPAPAATPTPVPTEVVGMMPKRGGTIVYPFPLPLQGTLDGHLSNRWEYQSTLHSIYNKLVTLGPLPQSEILADLAETWDISDDGTRITFNLRRGITFQDGSEFNAQVVKWNYDRILDPDADSVHNTDVSLAVDSVDVVDNFTVAVNLKKPDRPFLALHAQRNGYMLPPDAVNRLGEDFGANPVGSGPYRLTEFLPGNKIVMEGSLDYWEEGQPYLDRIEITNVADPSVRLAMLRTDEGHLLSLIRGADLPLVEQNPNLTVATTPTPRYRSISSSTAGAPSTESTSPIRTLTVSSKRPLRSTTPQGPPTCTIDSSGW